MDRTMLQYKEFLRWISSKSEGILYFDYDSNWGYNVKVNSISEGKFMVSPNCVNGMQNPTYNIELTVGFITKNDWAAKLIATPAKININNMATDILYYWHLDGTINSLAASGDELFSISRTSAESGKEFRLKNLCNVPIYLEITLPQRAPDQKVHLSHGLSAARRRS
jgi:hypothetical protein